MEEDEIEMLWESAANKKWFLEGQIEGQGIGVSIPTSLPAFTRFFVGMG